MKVLFKIGSLTKKMITKRRIFDVPYSLIRTLVLAAGAEVGTLCSLVGTSRKISKCDLAENVTKLLLIVLRTARCLQINLLDMIGRKQQLNGKKYPAKEPNDHNVRKRIS